MDVFKNILIPTNPPCAGWREARGADEPRNVDRKTPPVPVFCPARSLKDVPAKTYPFKVVKRFWEIT